MGIQNVPISNGKTMCVIIFKPKGNKMPHTDVLRACAKANPHGVGYCTNSGKFHKSTNVGEILKEIKSISIEESAIIHFRYATHGAICDANCHPFRKGNTFFAHNGILDIRPDEGKTDSETAFVKQLYPLIEAHGLDSSYFVRQVRKILGGSKFAFLQGDEVRLFGQWAKLDGCYFSNIRWQFYQRAPRGQTGYLSAAVYF